MFAKMFGDDTRKTAAESAARKRQSVFLDATKKEKDAGETL